jgi:hypothetical protein
MTFENDGGEKWWSNWKWFEGFRGNGAKMRWKGFQAAGLKGLKRFLMWTTPLSHGYVFF